VANDFHAPTTVMDLRARQDDAKAAIRHEIADQEAGRVFSAKSSERGLGI